MKRTLMIKLAPSPEQRASLLNTMEAFNAACNGIAEIAFQEQCVNKFKLHKLVYYDTRATYNLSAQMAVRAISKVVESYKRDKSIKPTFAPHGAMVYDERVMSFKGLDTVSLLTLDGRVLVPMILGGYQSERQHLIKGQADLLYRKGVFYLAVSLDYPDIVPDDPDGFLGVDVGIVNLAVDSDGTVYSGAEVAAAQRTYAHRRRNLQRKQTRAATRKLRGLSGKQANFQRNTNHEIAKSLVAVAKDTKRGIALEDLGGIGSRIRLRKRQRATFSNWGFAQLRSFIQYKAEMAGIVVVAVDPRNTSRTCPSCGLIDKRNRPNQATFLCIGCGFAGLADHVAAGNISARAAVTRPNVSTCAGKASGTNLDASPISFSRGVCDS